MNQIRLQVYVATQPCYIYYNDEFNMMVRFGCVAALVAAAQAIPWDPKTGVPMNGEYTYAKPGSEGVAKGA